MNFSLFHGGRPARLAVLLTTLMLSPLLTSCGVLPRGEAVPRELEDQATVLGDPAIRSWDDRLSAPFLDEVFEATLKNYGQLELDKRGGKVRPVTFLAISGGGSDGAFGAGFICGWTAAGTRPTFDLVTGVSTGALIAPFAFLGSDFDHKLRTVYTSVATRDIATRNSITRFLLGESFMDTGPLESLIAELIDEAMMRDIAAAYAKGRVLIVATTNLDARRGVLWNIGAIAASGKPGALELIHKVLIASAAIPAAFPPVMLDVDVDAAATAEADGQTEAGRFQEMHVDGGVMSQVFLYPPSLPLRLKAANQGLESERRAYIIRNARLEADRVAVRRRTLAIAARSISALISTQGIGDLFRIYLIAKRDEVDFNLAYISGDIDSEPEEHFDPVFMTKLFNLGFDAATTPGGYQWRKEPPGFTSAMEGRDAEVPQGDAPPAK